MDAREIKEAGNALIGWFNSQELTPHQSLIVMRKVIAKIIVKDFANERDIHKQITLLQVDLLHDCLERLRDR